MNELDLFQAVIDTFEACLPAYGFTDKDQPAAFTIRQGYQGRVQGAPVGPTLLLQNITNHRHGFTGKNDTWDVPGKVMRHTEKQAREVTLQCNALVPLNAPAAGPGTSSKSPYNFTAGDLANVAATILASDAGLRTLKEAGLGIERIVDVRQPYFQDDKDQFEASPSFDFVLCFTQVDQSETPIIVSKDFKVYRV